MNFTFNNQVSSIRPLYEYLKKQRENQKFIKTVEISATFFLITFFLYFAIRPTFLAISALNGQIESKKILKKELKGKINNVIQAQDLFSQVQERYQVINSSLPDRPYYFDASSQIRKSSSQDGLIVDNMTFDFNAGSGKEIDPNTKFYSVSLAFNGQYKSSLNLVSELLKNRRLINISSLKFSTDKDQNTASSSASQVNSRFSAIFYYWPNSNEKK